MLGELIMIPFINSDSVVGMYQYVNRGIVQPFPEDFTFRLHLSSKLVARKVNKL